MQLNSSVAHGDNRKTQRKGDGGAVGGKCIIHFYIALHSCTNMNFGRVCAPADRKKNFYTQSMLLVLKSNLKLHKRKCSFSVISVRLLKSTYNYDFFLVHVFGGFYSSSESLGSNSTYLLLCAHCFFYHVAPLLIHQSQRLPVIHLGPSRSQAIGTFLQSLL